MHPDLAEGARESWASGSGASVSSESHSRGWKPDLNIVCLEIIDESIGKREKKALKFWAFFMRWGFSTMDSSEVQRQCERSEPWRVPRPQLHGTLHKQAIVKVTKALSALLADQVSAPLDTAQGFKQMASH